MNEWKSGWVRRRSWAGGRISMLLVGGGDAGVGDDGEVFLGGPDDGI